MLRVQIGPARDRQLELGPPIPNRLHNESSSLTQRRARRCRMPASSRVIGSWRMRLGAIRSAVSTVLARIGRDVRMQLGQHRAQPAPGKFVMGFIGVPVRLSG